MYYKSKYHSKIGTITIESDETSIVGLWFDGQKYYEDTVIGEKQEKETKPIKECKTWLNKYFKGENPKITFPLNPNGSEFRKCVWNLLLQIPYGQTTTYKALAQKTAKQLNKKTYSAQAIGGAVSHNPISIIIPCHRVIGTNGSLTGYAGGIEKKIKLLQLEKVNTENLKKPKNNSK